MEPSDTESNSSISLGASVGAAENDDESSVTSLDSMSPEYKYRNMMEEFRNWHDTSYVDRSFVSVAIDSLELLRIVLNNIDEFCAALSPINALYEIQFGSDHDDNGNDWPELDSDEENAEAWTKFLRAIGGIKSIDNFALGSHKVRGKLLSQVLLALTSTEISNCTLFLAWNTISDEGMGTFVNTLSRHRFDKVSLWVSSTPAVNAAANGDLKLVNRFQVQDGIMSRLLQLGNLDRVNLYGLTLIREECISCADILISDAFSTRKLSLSKCTFLDGGGQFIADALGMNTVLKTLDLRDVFEDDAFCGALVSSLPHNTSIQELVVRGLDSPSTLLDLCKSIVSHQHHELKKVKFLVNAWPRVTECQKRDLFQSFEQNYTLEEVFFGEEGDLLLHAEAPVETITRLNKAGRRYLREDATSKSKCIEVLDKVRDDLDCLFFHLRENPVLFTAMEQCNGKRKTVADSQDEEARQAKKKRLA